MFDSTISYRSMILFAISASLACGQATRTWVSGVGDDANPCSRTAPCKTFAGAISKTAASGEIDVLDPGGFGAVTITKSITIDGTPVIAGVLVSGTPGIVINAAATDTVVLRGLDIDGLTTGTKGVEVLQAQRVSIEDCQIYGFTPRGISIEPTSNPVDVSITNTRIKNSTSNGVVVSPTAGVAAHVALNNVTISGNTNFGLSITQGGVVVMRDSIMADNAVNTTFSAIRIDGTGGGTTSLDMDNVVVSGSPTGIIALNGGTVRLNNSGILNNGTGLSASSGGAILSFGNNRLAGNA